MANYVIQSNNQVQHVEIELTDETVVLESGAMHYMRGYIEVETKVPSIGGVLKAGLTGENVVKPKYSGTGTLVLEPSFNNYFLLELNNEEYVLDQGAFVACDDTIDVSAQRNKLMTGLRSGEGMFQTKVSGMGTVVVASQGEVQVIDLVNDKLSVDGTFAVARSATLDYSVQKVTKSLLGAAASGEGFVNVFEGTGRVYLAPVPNFATMLRSVLYNPYATAS